jgi:hypothetical protein
VRPKYAARWSGVKSSAARSPIAPGLLARRSARRSPRPNAGLEHVGLVREQTLALRLVPAVERRQRRRDLGHPSYEINRRVERKINPRFNPPADDAKRRPSDHAAMTTTDYIINAAFLLVVLRQARARQIDRRALVLPLLAVFFVAQQYVHTIPTAGNDLVLIGGLAAVGLSLGLASGFATDVHAGRDGIALARVGWLAGILLVSGIGARMAFAFALTHGAEPAVRAFSITHQIGAVAWPVALVAMAVCEVTVRLATVQIRGRRLLAAHA